MAKVFNSLVSVNKQILGGTPVVAGTRIPIIRLKYLVKSGYDASDLQQEYPHVDIEKINSVLSYLIGLGLNSLEKKKSYPSR